MYGNIVKEFLKEKKYNQGLTKGTIKNYIKIFNHIVESKYLDINNPKTFNLKNTICFFQERSKNWKPITYNSYRGLYMVFVRYLVREYGIYDFSQHFREKKQEKKLPKFFSKFEIKKILKGLNQEEQNIVYFFLYTGMRKAEFCSLKKTDIRNGTIRIRNGKGKKERIIPLHPELLEGKLNFPYSKKYLENLGRRIKFKKFGWHRLRHTFATNLIYAGVDIYTISQLMGHSDITTTTRYLSLDIRKKEEGIKKLKFDYM